MHLRRKELVSLLEGLKNFIVENQRLPQEDEWRATNDLRWDLVKKYGGIRWLTTRLILRLLRLEGWDKVPNEINSPNELPPLMTLKQAADYLQVSTETVKRYIYEERLTGVKLAREWRIRREDMNEFLDSRTHGASELDPLS